MTPKYAIVFCQAGGRRKLVARTQVRLIIKRLMNGRVRMTWGDGIIDQPSYHLNDGFIIEKVEKVRTALEALANTYRQPKPDHTAALAELAKEGYRLRMALFNDRYPEHATEAAEALEWFSGLGPRTVTVNADSSMPVPWGILHEGEGGGGDVYQGFWAPRFAVAAVYSGMRSLPRRQTGGGTKLLAGLNQEVFGRTQANLEEAQRGAITAMFQRPVGSAYTVEGCKTRWRDVGDNDCVIYFFGHATGKEIFFDGEGQKLSVSAFRETFRRESAVVMGRTPPMKVLTVLNGCLSASGGEANNFMLATTEPGFYGFVGAEAPIPDRLGLLFGHELLKALLEDRLSVREAMTALWDRYRPLGLLYGCYAHPELSVASNAA